MSSVTANSRMIYAFSRDGALPGSQLWHQVNKRTRTPTNAIWLAAGGALILGLPYLWNSTAYARRHLDRGHRPLHRLRDCRPSCGCARATASSAGPWHLGRWSYAGRLDRGHLGRHHHDPVHAAARRARSRWTNFNYTVVAVVAVIGFAGIYWLVSARKWFTGPKVQGTAEELAAIEQRTVGLSMTDQQRGRGSSGDALPGRAARARRHRRDRHGDPRADRHAGPAAGQAAIRRVLPGRGRRTHYSEGCNYLLAVDVGHEHRRRLRRCRPGSAATATSSCGPDLATLRRIPWHPATALVLADLTWLDGTPGASPRRGRSCSGRSAGSPSAAWSRWPAPSWSSSSTPTATSRRGRKNYRDLSPANDYNVDYSILGTSRIEPLLRRHPQRDGRRGPVRRVGQGRVQPRPARDRVPLRRRAHDLRQPLDLQDRREGDRGPGRHEHHVHGQAERSARATPATSTCRCAAPTARPVLAGDGPHGLSQLGEHFLAGQLAALRELTLLLRAQHQLLQAVRAGQLRADRRSAGAWTTGRCALRLVGHGHSLRAENRTPGGDVNPYLAVAGDDRGRPARHRQRAAAGARVRGNAYADDEPRVPHTLRDAPGALAGQRARQRGLRRPRSSSTTRTTRGWSWPPTTPRSPTGSCAAASSACSSSEPLHRSASDQGHDTPHDQLHRDQSGHRAAGRAGRAHHRRADRRGHRARRAGAAGLARGRARRPGPAAAPRSPSQVDAHIDELAALETADSGHPVGAASWEAGQVRDVLAYYAGRARSG